MSETINVLGGLDLGNGYVKAKLSVDGGKPKIVDMPSCASYISAANWMAYDANDGYIDNLHNEMDADIDSPAIPKSETMRLIFGKRAVASGNTPVVFNIDDSTPKCNDPLSVQLACDVLASVALAEHWHRHGKLPDDVLKVNAWVGMALPVSDYKDYRDIYANRFKSGVHTVNIHNFEQPVRVDITFEQVTVLAEGAAAQYAISDLGEAFLDKALEASRAAGLPTDPDETGATLLSYKDTIGIDIGEGTVNAIAFRAGNFSTEISSSINKGYGTVLSNVVEQLRNHAAAPQSRKDLAEFMLKENPSARDRKLMALFQNYIDAEIRVFVRDVVAEFTRVFRKAQLNTDVVYVYGGGANPVRHLLYPALINAAKVGDDIYTPVIYLDSSFSRDLNRNGLYQVAQLAADYQAKGGKQ